MRSFPPMTMGAGFMLTPRPAAPQRGVPYVPEDF